MLRFTWALAGWMMLGWVPPVPAGSAPSVELFTPQGQVREVHQARARFSAPLVALGDPRPAAPFEIECPVEGNGRWVDTRNWVYDFDSDLPSGLRCVFSLKPDLATVEGTALEGRRLFVVETGGPVVRASLPYEGDAIDEHQAFLLAVDGEVDVDSIASNVHCQISGAAEQVEVDLLEGDEREQVLAARRHSGYGYRRLLWDDAGHGLGEITDEIMKAAERSVLAVRCRRALAPDTEVFLVWGRGVSSPTGMTNANDRILAFKTRPAFSARFECQRVNADAGCIPMLPMVLGFSAQVAVDEIAGVKLVGNDGRLYEPVPPGGAPFVTEIRFPGPFPPESRFELKLPAGLTDDSGRTLANATRFPLEVVTDEYPPLIKFPGEFGILELEEGGVLPVTLRNLEPSVDGRRLAPGGSDSAGHFTGFRQHVVEDARIISWLKRVEAAGARRGEWLDRDTDHPRWKEETGNRSVLQHEAGSEGFTIPRSDGGKAFEVVGIPLEKPGFHVVELASPRLGEALLGESRPRYVATSALVTNLGVHFKWGREASLVWVTTLDKAKPVADATVQVSDHCTGEPLWSGTTDQQGIAWIGAGVLPEPTDYESCSDSASVSPPLFVSARLGTDMSFVLSSWNDGIAPGDFGLSREWDPESLLTHTLFDRTLLRAGERVSMKHFVREPTMNGFAVPAGDLPDRLSIRHRGSGQEYELALTLDGSGIGESVWDIPREAALGAYDVTMKAGDSGRSRRSGTFQVEEFRVPTMKAVIQPPAAPQIHAETVPLDLYVGYLNGGGAGGAPVRLRTLLRPRALSFPDYDSYVFGGAEPREGIEDYGESDGMEMRVGARPAQVLPLKLDDSGAVRAEVPIPASDDDRQARDLVAELEYEDANGERMSVSTRVPLWPAGVVLGIRTHDWAMSADQAAFKVVALDVAGKPLANQQVDVDAFKVTTYSYRRRLVGGFYGFESRTETRRLGPVCGGLTDASGLLHCEFDPGTTGDLVLSAAATDAKGNRAVSTRSLWIADENDTWFDGGASDRMDLVPLMDEYLKGESARIQVRTPFDEATALVTVEREGVLDARVVSLDRDEPVVEVPIENGYAPNVFVSVLAVRGRVSGWPDWLADVADGMGISLERKRAAPTATVDLSKPAYRLGMTELKVDWAPHRLDVRVLPEREVYEVRDKAKVKIQVTPALGGVLPDNAEIALAAVDQGLLELKPNDSWKLLESMMAGRGTRVLSSTAQMQVVGKRHYGRKALPDGGGGGGESARELFDTLLLWRGRVSLDVDGAAEVEVPLNDSLTAFRLVAVASAGTDLFGTGEGTIRTTQDVMLLPGLAPLVRERDHLQALFTVRNSGDQTLSLRLVAESEPQREGIPMTPLQLAPKQVELVPGEARQLAWDYQVPQGADSLKWDVRAEVPDGRVSDRLILSQKVEPVNPVRVLQATLLRLDDSLSLPLERPADALPGRGSVRLSLQARLADGVEGVAGYMKAYPYSCLEQRVSRAVALDDETLWNDLMGRMAAYADDDGLFRYFNSASLHGSDTLTSYVLAVTHQAGREIPARVRSRALSGLKNFVEGRLRRDSPLPTADLTVRKLAAIEALSRYGEATPEMLDSIIPEPNLWPTSAVLDWMGTLKRVEGVPLRDERLAEAEQILRARLNFQGTTLGFTTERTDALWWLMVTPELNAVRAILTVLDRPGWEEDIPRMMRGALGWQNKGHWRTTPANAWGVLALDAFSGRFESEPVGGRTTAMLDGRSDALDWSSADGANTAGGSMDFSWPDGRSILSLAHEGSGVPWVSVQSRAAVPLKEPFAAGFKVTRRMTPVEQQVPGRWTRGDVARITLDVEAQSDMSWVVVDDPVPAGATVLGKGLGGDSGILVRDEQRTGVWPVYEERRFDAFRAYYEWVPKGRWTLEYTVRFNNAGELGLPATRVEAMYAPEMFAEMPNATLSVQARP